MPKVSLSKWEVVHGKKVANNAEELTKYINDRVENGWELKFVDSGLLFFFGWTGA